MTWQDLIERHEASPATVAKIRGQRAQKLARKQRYWLSQAQEGVEDMALIYMGECGAGDGAINFGYYFVRRGDQLYHAGCDPA